MRDILKQGALKLNVQLSETALDKFSRYYEFLEEKNRVMNLTTITDKKDVAELHFLDSLSILDIASCTGKSVIDIGSGAGFPGVPMKIADPTLKLTLLEALQKKVVFLEELTRRLEMQDVQCLNARAEEAAHLPQMRDSFDFAVSRAVARLNVLIELCLPFVKPGGAFIAMKSTDSDQEIKEAENAAEKLGGKIERIYDYQIPGSGVTHRAVLIRKLMDTPQAYPRRFAKIQKSPL